jgi:hypothetical protein
VKLISITAGKLITTKEALLFYAQIYGVFVPKIILQLPPYMFHKNEMAASYNISRFEHVDKVIKIKYVKERKTTTN